MVSLLIARAHGDATRGSHELSGYFTTSTPFITPGEKGCFFEEAGPTENKNPHRQDGFVFHRNSFSN